MPQIQEADSEDLIQRMKKGEDAAFAALVRSNWDKVFSRAYGLLKNREDAEEVAQDTFIRAKRGVSSFRGECSASTWLHRIATNLARNKYWYWWRRKRGESLSIDSSLTGEASDISIIDTMQSEAPTPSDDALTSEFEQLLPQAMATLDEKYAQVLLMRTERELSYDEIAEELNISVGTVKSRLSRAREQLREALETLNS